MRFVTFQFFASMTKFLPNFMEIQWVVYEVIYEENAEIPKWLTFCWAESPKWMLKLS